jgi:hemoglobin
MKRLFVLFAACAALMLAVIPATTYAQHDDPDMEWEADGPLIDRLGGEEILSGIVDDFVSMAMADDKLKSHFEGSDQAKMKEMLMAQITFAAGGEIEYAGKTFVESLGEMGITGEYLESITAHMTASLEQNEAWPEDVEELLVVLELQEEEMEEGAEGEHEEGAEGEHEEGAEGEHEEGAEEGHEEGAEEGHEEGAEEGHSREQNR